eukprot:7373558-Prymnesium_polylepis.2
MPSIHICDAHVAAAFRDSHSDPLRGRIDMRLHMRSADHASVMCVTQFNADTNDCWNVWHPHKEEWETLSGNNTVEVDLAVGLWGGSCTCPECAAHTSAPAPHIMYTCLVWVSEPLLLRCHTLILPHSPVPHLSLSVRGACSGQVYQVGDEGNMCGSLA